VNDGSSSFTAVVVTERDGRAEARLTELHHGQLPAHAVLVRVQYSTINYKDALAVCRGAPVIRSFPMVPGVDLAGVVESSSDPRFAAGDAVLANGWGLGEVQWGGLSRYARVPGDFLTRIPPPLDPRQAMAIGTAGYTAMLAVMALERGGLSPAGGEVVVTGAAGGVGSLSISLLTALGYSVTASTGRVSERPYLETLGAKQVIDRALLSAPGKALQRERWAGAIDCVGGSTLANVCASMQYRGLVAACGLAQSMEFPGTVAPFILRGVTLFGIDSVRAPQPEREIAWRRLATTLPPGILEQTTREIGLDQVLAAAAELLAGGVRGRIVVKID
jgi:acrylyl-CoA reductase (NADPH)